MKKLKSTIPQKQLEKVMSLFPDYDKTPLIAEYDMMGNILKIETDNIRLNEILKNEGLIDN